MAVRRTKVHLVLDPKEAYKVKIGLETVLDKYEGTPYLTTVEASRYRDLLDKLRDAVKAGQTRASSNGAKKTTSKRKKVQR